MYILKEPTHESWKTQAWGRTPFEVNTNSFFSFPIAVSVLFLSSFSMLLTSFFFLCVWIGWGWCGQFIYHNWAFMLDDQVWVYVSERPHDSQPLVCCCYCVVPYIRPSLIVLLGFTCSPSPHKSSCSISQALLWSQSTLTEQFTNLQLGILPTRPTATSPPTQQIPCGWLQAKANFKRRSVYYKAKNTRAKTADFRVCVCSQMRKSWLFFPIPLRTPHCRRPYFGTSFIRKLGTNIVMVSLSFSTTTYATHACWWGFLWKVHKDSF